MFAEIQTKALVMGTFRVWVGFATDDFVWKLMYLKW